MYKHQFDFTENDFRVIQKLIYDYAGISLNDAKQNLVYSRLTRRLRANNITNFSSYLEFLSKDKNEWQLFINALTTNLTSFFREPHHFPILARHIKNLDTRETIALWSCAASTGEEPYSMAMTMVELFGSYTPPVRIIATDIDTQALEQAKAGIYSMEKVDMLTPDQLRPFFLKGEGKNAGLVKIREELKDIVTFRQVNLLNEDWSVRAPFAAIFCRNVMIYLDKKTQMAILQRFAPLLAPKGLLFVGHSENIILISDLFKLHSRTVYQLKQE
ncbi:MAG: CheR family methyltransferase [Candidatus Methylumidiphilus sp.]